MCRKVPSIPEWCQSKWNIYTRNVNGGWGVDFFFNRSDIGMYVRVTILLLDDSLTRNKYISSFTDEGYGFMLIHSFMARTFESEVK